MDFILKEEFSDIPNNIRNRLVGRINTHLRIMLNRYQLGLKSHEIPMPSISDVLGPIVAGINLAKDLKDIDKN